MKILIYGTQYRQTNKPYIETLLNFLKSNVTVDILYYKSFYEELITDMELKSSDVNLIEDYEQLKSSQVDFMFCLGGDGTILKAATLVRDTGIKIVGINLGRLGFLASVEKNKIVKTATQLLEGNYRIEKRMLLSLDSEPNIFGSENIALNDFTILKRDNSSMITIHTYVNGEFLNSYWGDGLVISTPTGSTGYSLSCGGPIIDPTQESFIITPVAPHHLSVRPIVLEDNVTITFEVEGRADNYLCTLDSRFEVITTEYKLAIRKCNYQINLVQFPDMSFIDTMRRKLLWGTDVRVQKN